MKLSHLIAGIGAASIAFQVVSNRKKIQAEANETLDLIAELTQEKEAIQQHLNTILSYRQPLQDMSQDLTYKLRTYQQSIAGNLEEIKKHLPATSENQENLVQ
ncbi:TPA: chemotaxis protein [Streptococcus suis]|nr:chemotaxis protein [Streptococcus suis]